MSIGTSNAPEHESAIFRSSSFGSRKAERAARGELAPRPKRLVSLGVKEMYLEPFGSKAKGQTVKIEYLVDMDSNSDYYTRAVPHGNLVKMDRGGITDPPPEYLGTIAGRNFTSGHFPDALPTPPVQLLT